MGLGQRLLNLLGGTPREDLGDRSSGYDEVPRTVLETYDRVD
jgi:hypothetical protein